jgi:hypothetical protein
MCFAFFNNILYSLPSIMIRLDLPWKLREARSPPPEIAMRFGLKVFGQTFFRVLAYTIPPFHLPWQGLRIKDRSKKERAIFQRK